MISSGVAGRAAVCDLLAIHCIRNISCSHVLTLTQIIFLVLSVPSVSLEIFDSFPVNVADFIT